MQLRILLIALLSISANAQFNGALPNVRQSYISLHIGGANNTVTLNESATSGNVIGVCLSDGSGAGTSTYGVTSVPAETWTVSTAIRTPDSGPNAGASASVAIAYTTANSTAAYAISATSSSGNKIVLEPFELENVSGAVDGAVVTNTVTGASSNISTAVTTTVNGDVIINCGSVSDFSPALLSAGASDNYLAIQANANLINSSEEIATARYTNLAGSYAPLITFVRAGSVNSTYAMESLAFKPATGVTVATTALSNADTVSAYSNTLRAVGGAGAYTWSIVTGALPTGLSLNTSTGAITGTASVVGTYPIGVRATDGSLTSSTKNLSISVTGAFSTPVIGQSKICLTPSTCAFTSNVTAGNKEVIMAMGFDTHGGEGWFNSAANLTTTRGTVFKMVPQASISAYASPILVYEGTILACGSETVSYTAVGGGSNLVWMIQELGNTQDVIDAPSLNFQRLSSASPQTYNSTYTTVVPNELIDVMSFATSAQGINDPTAMSIAAPFTSISSGTGGAGFGFYAVSQDQTTTATSYTAATTVTFPASTDTPASGTYMLGLRPSTPSPSCTGQIRQHGVIL